MALRAARQLDPVLLTDSLTLRLFRGRFRLWRAWSSDLQEQVRMEQALGTARGFLALAALAAMYIDPSANAGVVVGLLLIYGAYSLVVLGFLWRRPRPVIRIRPTLHGVDVAWAVIITFVTEGPSSLFFVFFLFVLLAAAFRWGLVETVATGIVAALLLQLQLFVMIWAPAWAAPRLEVNRLIMRDAYLLLFALLLGSLSEQEKELRAQASAVARIMSKVRIEEGLRASLQAVLDDLLKLFGAERALFAVEEVRTERLFLWDARRRGRDREALVEVHEVAAPQRATFGFAVPAEAHSWQLRRVDPTGERDELLALDAGGRRLDCRFAVPASLKAMQEWGIILCVSFVFGQEWFGRLYLIDPSDRPAGPARLRFLQTIVRQIWPALYNLYLVRRLRSRAGAIERARVARELHDGVIQSLIGLEMQLDVLRRGTDGAGGAVAEQIGHIQGLLRQEVLNVRDLMYEMRPFEVEPNRLLEFLTEVVDRFRRESGIEAKFVSELDEVELPPRVCRELARIVQEALVNIRKHSGASNVVVRLGARQGTWKLVVDDDGGGFDFTGRLTHDELDARRRGPVVIKERARAIGGALTIESLPGRGVRLEIVFPTKRHG